MKKYLFLFSTIISIVLVGQTNHQIDTINPVIKLKVQDTLNFKSVQMNEKKENFSEKNMPWIIALIIGILSVCVNIYIANRLRISTEKNIEKQIASSLHATKTQFKITIGTKNRQEWINEIRHNISDLLANSSMLSLEMKQKDPSSERIKQYGEKILYCRAKIELLLNDQKPEQIRLLNGLINFIDENRTATIGNPNNEKILTAKTEMINAARNLFHIHWQKIKDI